jgi:hypothetical protein
LPRGPCDADANLNIDIGYELRPGGFMITDEVADNFLAELSAFATLASGHQNRRSSARLRQINGLRGCTTVTGGTNCLTDFHKTASNLRTAPRRLPRCCRQRQRREAEVRRRTLSFTSPWPTNNGRPPKRSDDE